MHLLVAFAAALRWRSFEPVSMMLSELFEWISGLYRAPFGWLTGCSLLLLDCEDAAASESSEMQVIERMDDLARHGQSRYAQEG